MPRFGGWRGRKGQAMRKIVYFAAVVLAFTSCQQQQKRIVPETTQESEFVVDTVVVDSTEADVIDTDTETESTRSHSSDDGNARISQECFGAKDGYFDDLNKYCNRRDEVAVRNGIASGVFTVLQPGACTIVDSGFGKKKVRVNGEEWWVSTEFVD